MFKLHAVQARFGDCLILEYGTPAAPRFILIDGGPSDTFENHLEPALRDIVTTGRLDCAIVSHVDNDHIVGLLELCAALEEDQAGGDPLRVAVAELWHNSFQKALDPDGAITQRLQTLMAAAAAANVAMPLTTDAFFGGRDNSVRHGNCARVVWWAGDGSGPPF